ncbi:MAG: histidinol dehydrogenase, partial [Actinomycetota bacterium]
MNSPIRRVDLRGKRLSKSEYRAALPRAAMDIDAALQQIAPIINKVKTGTVADLNNLSEKFDGVRPSNIRVPSEVIEKSLTKLNPALRTVIEESIRRVRIVHKD